MSSMTQASQLQPGTLVERKLPEDGRHSYSLTLQADAYVRLTADQKGVDLVLRWIGPDGKTLASKDSLTGDRGKERIHAIVPRAGEHRVAVEFLAPGYGEEIGTYTLRADVRHPATVDDRLRASAFQQAEQAVQSAFDGRFADAKEGLLAAVEAWHQLDETAEEASARWWVGQCQFQLGENEGALRQLQDAEDLFRKLDHRAELASVLAYQGEVHRASNRYDESLVAYRQAVPLLREIGNREAERDAWLGVGHACLWLDRVEESMQAYEQTLDLLAVFPDDSKEAVACFGLGQLYDQRHDFERAGSYYERTVQAAERGGKARLKKKAQRRLASLLGKQGEVTEADSRLREKLAEIRRDKAAGTVEELLVLNGLGSLHLDAGAPAEALPHFEAALDLSRTLPSVPHEAMILQRLGRVHSALGDFVRAASFHHKAAALFETVPDRQGVVSARYSEARALYELDRYEDARELLEGLLGEAEALRAATQSHELRASWVASRRHYWELLVDTLMRLHERAPEKRFDVLALERSEEARARGLLDQLHEARVDIRRDADPRLVQEERRIREQLNVVERRRTELIETEGGSQAAHAELDGQRDSLLQALRKTERELRSAARQPGEALLDPSPLAWSQVQGRILDDQTQLLAYFVGEERSFAWLASREEDLVTGVLPGRDRLERLVRNFLDLVTHRNEDERERRHEAMRAAGEMILGPVAGKLAAERLLIVPDGVLHRVPFAALVVPGETSENEALLVDEHEIVLEPSISVLDTLMGRDRERNEPAKRIVVFADPVFTAADERLQDGPADLPLPSLLLRSAGNLGLDLHRLPHTSEEAAAARDQAAGRRLPCELHQGFDATKTALLEDDLHGIRVLHFATHALLHPEHPELSGIVLSCVDDHGDPQDGFLPLHEIYGLDLDAELVVLSACETGLGRQVRGEGLIGLPRGFFYAGAPRVIHTLWSVDDESTAELMSRFYGWHLGRGLSASLALAKAQRSMRSEATWSDPADWAAFVFQGDWTPPPESPDDPIGKLSMPDPEEEEPPPDDSVPTRVPTDDPPPEAPADRSLFSEVSSKDAEDLLYFNGLDASTGAYWTPPRTAEQLAQDVWAIDEPRLQENRDEDPYRVALVGTDTRNLAETGWGVIFPSGVSSEIERALSPLLQLRERQVNDLSRFRRFYVDPNDSAPRWLAHMQAGRGAVLKPEKLPYYLLMVGGPEELPFELQLKLGGSYAVGRIAFDHVDEYRQYAERVARFAERSGRLSREAVLFGATHEGDRATERTTRDLVNPLADRLERRQGHFNIRRLVGKEATKHRLLQLLGGSETPAVLFTAGHGLAYPPGHPQQRERQGALVCSDLAGPFGSGPISPRTFVSAEDLTESQAAGLISFHFACYGAGTPSWDGFAKAPRTEEHRQASHPFLSRLPQRLLADPNGSLAVVGHVDRAWTTSFSWEGERSQPDAFEKTLDLLFQGQPVGAALDPIRHLWNEVAKESNDLWQRRERKELGPGDERRFAHYWTANNDARAFVICGDPAVTVAARGIG